ncbi:MAG: hypothetical protein WAN11_06255 [Syntrophobacteraceae bacterium]
MAFNNMGFISWGVYAGSGATSDQHANLGASWGLKTTSPAPSIVKRFLNWAFGWHWNQESQWNGIGGGWTG